MANVQYNKDNDAITGAVQIAKLVRDETTERDEDEKFSTDELIPALTEAKAALAEEVENLGNERLSVELRRQLLQDRRDRLAERLSSRALDLERRMTGVVERYLFATAALEYRAHGFAEALRAVFATASPSGLLIALTDAATFDESDRGAQLEQIELHLQKMQDWFSHLSSISRRTALAKPLSCEVDAGKYRTSALIEAPTGNAIGQLARVRGMRVVAPFATASIPCRVMLVAPTHAKQKIGDALVDMNQPSLEHTHE